MALRYCRSVNNYVADEDDENAAKLIGHPLEIGHGFDDKRCGWGGLVLREATPSKIMIGTIDNLHFELAIRTVDILPDR